VSASSSRETGGLLVDDRVRRVLGVPPRDAAAMREEACSASRRISAAGRRASGVGAHPERRPGLWILPPEISDEAGVFVADILSTAYRGVQRADVKLATPWWWSAVDR